MGKAAPRPKRENGSNSGRFVEYDRFIDEQLGRTRNQVRSVDAVSGLMTLAAAALAFFLFAAILDHWLIPGGLGFWSRALLCALLAGGAGYYFAVELLPLCLKRINPVYAAHTIERSSPSLKNSLVNFLLLKRQRAAVPDSVFQAIEEQAATGLSRVPAEAAVDRSRLIRVGYVLLGLLAVAALYKILSPKDPLATVERVVLPWADIQPPTRVSITLVEPGATQAFRGQRVEVSAEVHGLAADGQVRLVYATADGKNVDQQIRMTMPADSRRYSCQLPDGSAGLQQDVDYHVEAGDARSKTYRVTVVAAPTIVVQSVDYVYPDYTGLARQQVEHQGDLKAIEGTRVTLHALANQPIKSGAIDFNCDGREDKSLDVQGDQASVTFKLELSDDRRGPEYGSYQLRFRNHSGQENPQPIAHRIEVTPDLPPEIEFLSPKSVELNVPARASVGMEIVANDPDFALRRVRLQAKVGDKPVADKVLLDALHQGQFVTHKLRFDTARIGLKVGDLVEYWAIAEDNKTPQPNRVETRHRWLRIVSPSAQQNQQDQLASRDDDIRPESGKGKPGDQENAGNPGDDHDQPPPKGKSGDQKDQRGKGGDDQPQEADDRNPQPGQNPQQGKPGQNNDQRAGKQAGGQQSKPVPGDQQQPDQEPGGQQGQDAQNGQSQSGAGQNGGQPQNGGQQGQQPEGGKQNGGKQGSKQNGGKQSGEQQASQQQNRDDSSRDSGGESTSPSGQNQRGGNEQNGQKGQKGAAGDDQQPVPSDGSDDASAIERILQDRQQHGDGSADESSNNSGNKSSGNPADSKPGKSGDRDKPDQPENRADKNRSRKDQEKQEQQEKTDQPGSREEANGASGQQRQGTQADQKQQRQEKSGEQRDDSGKPGQDQQPGNKSRSGEQQPKESREGQQPQSPQQRGEQGDRNMSDGKRGQRGEKQPDQPGGKPDSAGGKSEQPAGKQDQGGSQGQPGNPGDKHESGAGDDSRPGDRTEQGSAPGQEKRRPGENGAKENGDKSSSDQAPGQGGDSSQPSDSKMGDSKSGDSKSGESKSGDTKPGGSKPGEAKASDAKSGDDQQGAKPAQSQQPDGQGKPGDKPQSSEDQPGQRGAGDRNQQGERQPGQRDANRQQGETQPPGGSGRSQQKDGQQSQSSGGQGERSKGDTGQKPQKRPSDEAQPQDSRGGDGQQEKGQSGAGNSSHDKKGSPDAQNSNQQRNKTQDGGGRNGMQPNDTAQSPSNSDRQSDSQSDSSGDRSGGGAGGGGQKANKKGTGGAGQNSEAEEGAGKGTQPGEGETGGAGDRQQADGQTGSAGKERGNGSQTRRRPGGADGKQPQPDKQNPAEQQPQGQGSKEAKPGQSNPQGGKQGAEGQQGQSGKDEGQGAPGSGAPNGGGTASPEPPPEPEADVPTPADDPNLEYARKATDLALEHLKDQAQRGQPDPELMKKLGWNREDLKNFIDRWEKMRRRADQQGAEGEAGRRELDGALRSLGLRPRSTALHSNTARDDQARGLKESRRTQPPAEYAEQYKAYTQGTSRGGK